VIQIQQLRIVWWLQADPIRAVPKLRKLPYARNFDVNIVSPELLPV
jgi:hypothetical protein